MCGTEGWKNRLKYSSSPRCNRIDILCWLSLNTPDNLWKLSRTGWLSSGASPEMGWEGIWDQPSCTAGMVRWEGNNKELHLDLDPCPAFGSSCCVWVGWSSFRGCSRPSPSLHSHILPLYPQCHALLVLQGSVSHQILLLQYFWCSLQLMLGELNCPNFNYLCRLKKPPNILDFKMQCCL